MPKTISRALLSMLSMSFVLAGTAHAASVRVTWNPTVEPFVAGYLLHYGPAPGAYTGTINVGNVLWWDVQGLTEGTTYYFRVQAYDGNGGKSPLSNELTIAIPGTTEPDPAPPTSYMLVGGATGPSYILDVSLANPNDLAAPVTLYFRREDGAVIERPEVLAPRSHRMLRVNDLPGLESGAVSTIVHSEADLPLVVEHSMFWTRQQPAAAVADTAFTQASRSWFLAEGAPGDVDAVLLLANGNRTAATVDVTFLRERGAPVQQTYQIAPETQLSISASTIAELSGQAFSAVIDSNIPLIASRSVLLGPERRGGHTTRGITEPGTSWYHAEGITGNGFDTFITVANPGSKNTRVTFTYLLDSGDVISKSRTLRQRSVTVVPVASEDRRLQQAVVSTIVTSDLPIVSERSTYWGGSAGKWLESHNSFGSTEPAPRWALAGGRTGGTLEFQTFLQLVNPNDTATPVKITFLRADGQTVTREYTLPPVSRRGLHVNSVVPELANQHFGAIVESTTGSGIVVEQSVYFANGRGGTSVGGRALPR